MQLLINHIGYETFGPKQAVLLSRTSELHNLFAVIAIRLSLNSPLSDTVKWRIGITDIFTVSTSLSLLEKAAFTYVLKIRNLKFFLVRRFR